VCFNNCDEQEWYNDKKKIGDQFAIKDLGECNWILNMKLIRDRPARLIQLSQQAYVEKMVKTFGTNGLDQVKVPGTDDLTIPPIGQGDIILDTTQHNLYQALVGSLLYAANITRIDVCYAVSQLCRFTSKPSLHHLQAAYRVLKYLNDTSNLCLEFGSAPNTGEELNITAYSDADFAGDKIERKSTSGSVIKFNGDIIKWVSKKQKSVATSTMESEYYAVSETTKEILWALNWIKEVFELQQIAKLYCDNKAAIQYSKNDSAHDRSKHIDIRYHFVRDEIKKGRIIVNWIETSKQLADILTKALGRHIHTNLRNQLMGVIKS
jgi:hypothetical protein